MNKVLPMVTSTITVNNLGTCRFIIKMIESQILKVIIFNSEKMDFLNALRLAVSVAAKIT